MRALLVSLAIAASACDSGPPAKNVSVDEAAALFSSGAVPIDVNGRDYRVKHGVIPNAVLLASKNYDPDEVLPADKQKPLVFYCSTRL